MVEVMVVVAIMGIVMGIGFPALRDMLANQRLRTAAHALVGSVMYARGEAQKRGTDVAIVAPSSDDLSLGWCVQIGSAAACSVSAPGVAVMQVQQPTSGVSYAFSTTAGPIILNRSGRMTGSMVKVEVSDTAQTALKRCVIIDSGGSARTDLGACP